MSSNRRRVVCLAALLVVATAACGSSNKQGDVPREVTSITESTPVIPTKPACAPLPSNMSLDVEPVSATAVRLSGAGFEPGEKLVVVLTRKSHQRGFVDWHSVGPVASDGHFTATLHVAEPVTNTWELRLTYDDSAVCRTVTVPY